METTETCDACGAIIDRAAGYVSITANVERLEPDGIAVEESEELMLLCGPACYDRFRGRILEGQE